MTSVDEAITIVADEVLAALAEGAAEQWENYPEIGEDDWNRIVKLIERKAPHPGNARYFKAYELLELRAERVS